jgi:hypothetical protein
MFSDVTFWLEVRSVANPGAGNVVLTYETSPSADDGCFQPLATVTLAASPSPVITKIPLGSNPAVPLARFVRWKLQGTQSGSWSTSFRVFAAAGHATVATVGLPSITSFNYTVGDAAGGGQSIVISGTNLDTVTSCTFGGTAASITGQTLTTLTVTLPAHAAGTVDVAISNPSGTATATGAFKFVDPTALVKGMWEGASYNSGTGVWAARVGGTFVAGTGGSQPSTGASLAGQATLSFNGTSQDLVSNEPCSTYGYIGGSNKFGFAVVKVNSLAAAAANPWQDPPVWQNSVGNAGLPTNSTAKIEMYVYDGVGKVDPVSSYSAGDWAIVLFKSDGSKIYVSTNGTWDSGVACGAESGFNASTTYIRLGTTYTRTPFTNMLLAAFGVSDTVPTDVSALELFQCLQQRWGL